MTCFLAGTDLEMKKSRAVFSKFIMSAGEMSPSVKTGALVLVGGL